MYSKICLVFDDHYLIILSNLSKNNESKRNYFGEGKKPLSDLMMSPKASRTSSADSFSRALVRTYDKVFTNKRISLCKMMMMLKKPEYINKLND